MGCCYTSARDGDPAAKRNLIENLRPRIDRMAAYYSRCTGEEMEDLRQEAWFGLLEALRELNPSIGQPDQYLVQRARWRMLDSVKRERIRRCAPLEDSIELADRPHDRALGMIALGHFAMELSSGQRDVLACLMSGQTWREAGVNLGCTSANVAYHVRQIRKRYEDWTNS